MTAQRKKIASHRLWGRHPILTHDSWTPLATGNQKELEGVCRIRSMDTNWHLKTLPIGDVPCDLEEMFNR